MSRRLGPAYAGQSPLDGPSLPRSSDNEASLDSARDNNLPPLQLASPRSDDATSRVTSPGIISPLLHGAYPTSTLPVYTRTSTTPARQPSDPESASPTGSTTSTSTSQVFRTPALSPMSDRASSSGIFADSAAVDRLFASTSSTRSRSIGDEEDLGERTFVAAENLTPRPRPIYARSTSALAKGKERMQEISFEDVSASATSSAYDRASAADDDESRRIEENLRRWAKKEKLRRAQTRNRQGSIPPAAPAQQAVGDGIAAVTGLVRRMSAKSRHARSGDRLDSVDSGGIRLVVQRKESEDLEMQIQPRSRHVPTLSELSIPPTSVQNPFSPEESASRPVSSVSSTFPDRAERAVRAGSRFIEDLEDQEIRPSLDAASGVLVQTYAELNSPFASPVTSPARENGRPPTRSKLRLKTALRGNSLQSLSSITSYESKDTVTPFSPPDSRQQSRMDARSHPFYDQRNDSYDRLVDGKRSSNYTDTPTVNRRSYYDDEEQEYEDNDHGSRQVGWLEYILCCGCCNSGVRLEDDEQAGRTFPE